MLLIDEIVERRIREATDRGEFEGLPGAGKPFSLDDDRLVPEELRTGYRLLKKQSKPRMNTDIHGFIVKRERANNRPGRTGGKDNSSFICVNPCSSVVKRC